MSLSEIRNWQSRNPTKKIEVSNMKIAFVLRHDGVFRHFDRVIRELCNRGHFVKIITKKSAKTLEIDRALQTCVAEVARCGVLNVPPLRGLRWRVLSQIRELINYAIYFRPTHPSYRLAKRWEKFLNPPLKLAIKNIKFRNILVSAPVQKLLKNIEKIIPADKDVVNWLCEFEPDVVVASPFVFGSSLEVAYVKAAKSLGISTVVPIASWDNLTTKGTFHIYPDMMFVWNQALLTEAVELHDVPRDTIQITGAPTFDDWFDMQCTQDYQSLCRKIGINSEHPYVIYLSSSLSIAGDETPFVAEICNILLENESSKNFTVLIRPHPLNASIWDGFSMSNVEIWPLGGDIPDTLESKQEYYDMLYHCKAVVGVNTSAFLEAAIVDKPCVTIMTDHYRHSQGDMGHFYHLLHGDFIEVAQTFSQAGNIITRIVNGTDEKAENRRKFVKDFIRPNGMEESCSRNMAIAIEKFAQKR